MENITIIPAVAYLPTVENARLLARDTIRLEKISNKKDLIAKNSKDKADKLAEVDKWIEDTIKSDALRIARAEFSISKLDVEDPDFVEKKDRLDKDLEILKENVLSNDEYRTEKKAAVAKEVEFLDSEIKRHQDRIDQWVSGEAKVELSELRTRAAHYINIATDEIARGGVIPTV